ncbi:hypothetical protein BS78_K218800 [Paspalum vaginatum]|uniref:AAA+ ATPase domain-containing protein n=1 Tax=Paspalum vaginatum TaxID=158149 RepID=A0A9W7XBC2_9POAL|nr:hypothetical protein BS78_K218800 [Paspalum vaginatum]
MDLAEGEIGSLVPKLRFLLEDEYNLEGAVQRQLVFILDELQMIYSFLRAAEVRDEQVKIWERKVREFCYDMEDRIDIFLVNADASRPPERIGGKSSSSWLKRAMKKPIILGGKAHGDFAAAIEDMVMQLQELSERSLRYEYDHRFGRTADEIMAEQAARTSVDPRLPALYRNERELVGMDEARGELVKMLTQGDGDQRKLKIVRILGMGGVGKTTLAKAVYNSLEAEFDCSAFVSVSLNQDMKKVLRDIILELDDAEDYTRLSTMDDNRLIHKIQGFLKNNRFLIVIDDIWTTEVWKTIGSALVDSHCGSRVITTTRKYDVAVLVGMETYRLKSLSYDNSKKLFYRRIFGGEGNCPNNSQLDDACDKILKKCSGLPLAIITVASVFASKPLEEWSIAAFTYGSNRYVDNMRMVLSHSYYNLPSHLRNCVLHLSMFPENCWVEKDFLIWKWIAEGFVNGERGMSLFEIGERYFNELVNSSMIQIAEGHAIDGCRVHPVVFSLIRSISSEDYFSTVLGDDEHHYTLAGGGGSSNININIIARRIAMHRRNVEHRHIDTTTYNNMMSIGKVRSFSASLCFIEAMPQLSSFQVLRVLALEYCTGLRTSTHLRQIGNLVHLRYLGLVGAGVLHELPEETVGGLRLLQTLDLRETRIAKLPSSISKLGNLMCLCAGWIQAVPEGMVGSLISLEDLRIYGVTGGDFVKDLAAEVGRLQRLRVLEIGFEYMDIELENALVESLRKLDKIQHLEVNYIWYRRTVMLDDEQGGWVPPRCIRQLVFGGIFFVELPSWIHSERLPHLSHLNLTLDVVQDRHVKTLGSLPQLRSLVILLTDRNEEFVVVGADGGANFTQLRFFASNMPVKFETRLGLPPPMPNLEQVEFRVRSAPAAAEASSSWFSSLANLPSLAKATVVLGDPWTRTLESDEAVQTLRHEAGIVDANHRFKIKVTTIRENVKLTEEPFYHRFRFRNPHFKALELEMERMMSSRQEAGSSSAPR